MRGGRFRRPWHARAARLLVVAALALLLWAAAVASPFVAAHVLNLQGTAAQARALLAFAGSVLALVASLCLLLDRI
ncbi:MAG: hypothetical protein PHN82_10275 [bacterium]|nr:hypothetical protein [bacterium]